MLQNQITEIGGVEVWWPGLVVAGAALIIILVLTVGPIVAATMAGGSLGMAAQRVVAYAF